MKARYKIILAFVLLSTTLLAALCVLTYYITAEQQQRDFDKRLHNRTATIASLLTKLPSSNGYDILSKLDSSTNNLLGRITASVYNRKDSLLYAFSRHPADTFDIDKTIIDEAVLRGSSQSSVTERRIVAVYYSNRKEPIVVVVTAIDENGRRNLQELSKNLFLAFFAGIALSFLTGWIFSKQLLQPLEDIASKVNAISANNIEERLPETKINDEWNTLSLTFNGLLQRLQDSFELQGRFISNAAHELSTPLTAISNQIEVILQKSRTSEEYLSVLESVQADVQNLSALTQQLLNIARTARGGIVNTEPIRIDEVLMDLPATLKKTSPTHNALLFFNDLPENEDLCTVHGNYELLASAFRNITENGCKYSPDHTVQVSLSFVDKRIVVLFSNRFASFRPEEIEKIFQPFQRGSNAGKEQGYGLGLSLTRRIILLHKGEIKAEISGEDTLLITVILPSSARKI